MMTILYPAYGNLYVNLTNKCPCACTFCLRQTHEEIQQSGSLWLDREPTVEEVEKEFDKFPPDTYNDIVFCGFGEPTERLDALLEVAEFAKKKFGKENPHQHQRTWQPDSRERYYTAFTGKN